MWAEPGVEIVVGVLILNRPARDVACYSCCKQGHFSAHCLSKEVLALSVLGFEEEEVL